MRPSESPSTSGSRRAERLAQTIQSAVAALQCPDLFRLAFLAGAPLSSTAIVLLSIDSAPCRAGVAASLKVCVRRHHARVAVQYLMAGSLAGAADESQQATACHLLIHADSDLDTDAAWRARIEAFVIRALELSYLQQRVVQ